MKINTIMKSVTIASLIISQASAFCAYNRSNKEQTWYIFKDSSGNNAKRLLQGLQGTAITAQGIEAGTVIGKSIAEAVASQGATTDKAIADVLAEATKNKNIVVETVDLAQLSGVPRAGTLIRFDNSVLGKIGNLISMPATGARWGKKISAGDKACWNKSSVKKELGLDSETSDLYYLVLEDTDNAKVKKIAFAGAMGVDKGVEAF